MRFLVMREIKLKKKSFVGKSISFGWANSMEEFEEFFDEEELREVKVFVNKEGKMVFVPIQPFPIEYELVIENNKKMETN